MQYSNLAHRYMGERESVDHCLDRLLETIRGELEKGLRVKNFLDCLMEFRLVGIFFYDSLDYFIYIRHTVSSFMKKEKTPLTVGASPTTLKTSLPSSYIKLFFGFLKVK